MQDILQDGSEVRECGYYCLLIILLSCIWWTG